MPLRTRESDRNLPAPRRLYWVAFRLRYPLGFLVTVAVFVLAALPAPAAEPIPGLDKVGQLAEFGVVALAYLNIATVGFQRVTPRRIVLSLGLLVTVALAHHVFLYLLPGPAPDWRNLVAGLSAAYWLLAWAWAWVWRIGTVGSVRAGREERSHALSLAERSDLGSQH